MRIMKRGGEDVMVLRPADPKKALRIASEFLASQDGARFASLPSEVDDYTLAGWLGADGKSVLDSGGKVIGGLRPGDSFVTGSVEKAP